MPKSLSISGHESLWQATSEKFSASVLQKNFKTDICIIGAGITGITLAYRLTKEGKKVTVLDKGEVGFGETGYTTAHISNVLDDRYFEMEKIQGLASTKLLIQSHTAAIDRIESIISEEKIKCGFRRVDGYLFLGEGDKEEMLDRELAAVKKLGMKNVQKLANGPKGADLGTCLKFPDQAEFHPLQYLNELAKIIQKNGGEIYKDSLVQKIEEIDTGVTLRIENGHFIQAKTVIICTNAPCDDSSSFIYAKQAPYRTYVIVLEIPEHSVAEGLYWDTQKPFHYTRVVTLKDGKHGLMVGGEDHKTGQKEPGADPYARLFEYAKEKFPMVKEIRYQWSGQINETMDRLPLIGLNPGHKRVYVATGYSGSGMTYGTIASEIIGNLILEKKHPCVKLYSPGRIKLSGKLMKENLNVAVEYFADLLPQEHETLQKLPNDSGMVINSGLNKIAVYKDKKGTICKYSATCPHLGCFVHWNTIERTWDCPCHGSRFDVHGKVITGPATSPLKPVKD